MNERDIRKLMEYEELEDLWWTFVDGKKSGGAATLLSIIEANEGKHETVQILNDRFKNDPGAEWFELDVPAPAPAPALAQPVSTPKSTPAPRPVAAAPVASTAHEGHARRMTKPETEVWLGGPSQLLNIGLYSLCVVAVISGLIVLFSAWTWLSANTWAMVLMLVLLFLIPIGTFAWTWLVTKNFKYELTDQRLMTHSGVFSKHTDSLELYRVKDSEVKRPFWLRLIGRGHVVLLTSDRTTPTLTLKAVPEPMKQVELIRDRVEELRDSKRVREMDFSSEGDLDEFH